ncbi:MAG: S-layer homology domain-containing protein [Clostridia bacterium]|nr:S-layer homology domain-containing protein [Clostridia bacterium]
MKKLLSLILCLATVFAVFVTAPSAAAGKSLPFTDVKESDWFFGSVEYVYQTGIMNGLAEKKFAPKDSVTRAMFVTMLGRLEGVEQKPTDQFKDVSTATGGWYAGYVGWAADNGIVNGYPDRTFRTNDLLNREQMAAMISRYIKYTGILPTVSYDPVSFFTDEKKISGWAAKDVDSMRVLGIVAGNTDGTFSPNGNLTRAEAATVMMRLDKMIKYLELGDPTVIDYTKDGGRFVLMGAWDLYYAGTALWSNYKGLSVASDGVIPYLYDDPSNPSMVLGVSTDNNPKTGRGAEKNRNGLASADSFEIDAIGAALDLNEFPYLRFGYAAADGADVSFGVWSEIKTGGITVPIDPQNDGAEGDDGKEWKYGIADMTDVAKPTAADERYALTLSATGPLNLRYFAAFRTRAEAESFDPAEYGDQLAEWTVCDPVGITSATDADLEAAFAEAEAKAAKIRESRASYTEKDVKGTCYYISSIHGDDKNDGTSKDKPWKSFMNLYKVRAGGAVITSNLKEGDGVFLECGSVFVSESAGRWDYLEMRPGVIYSTYGEGDKPVITKRLTLTGNEKIGKWTATEWENVWRLDQPVDFQPGNITFEKDGKVLWGVFVLPQRQLEPYAHKTVYYGWVSNGEETFESGGIEFTSPGSLCHNLEYFDDADAGALYVYFDKGNPGEYFDLINIPRTGDLVGYGDDYKASTLPTRLDNVALKYSSWGGLATGDAANVYVTNCTFEWIGGGYQGENENSIPTRFGNAIQNWGSCDGVVVKDCYFADIYDAAVSTQGNAGIMRNFYTDGCVFDRCDFPLEFFNHGDTSFGFVSELRNIIITNNYVMNAGVGFCDIRSDRRSAFLYTSYGASSTIIENVRYENNVNIISREYATYSMDIALGDAPGTILKNNVYFIDPDETYVIKGLFNMREKLGSSKAFYPFSTRYLTYLASVGVETGSTFYTVKNPSREIP